MTLPAPNPHDKFGRIHNISAKDASTVANFINSIAAKLNYPFPQLTANDIFFTSNQLNMWIDSRASKKIFDGLTASSMANLWFYKKAKRIYEIVDDDILPFSALCINEENDYGEYSECMMHLGYHKAFYPDPQGIPPIKHDKENNFIFCTTNTFNLARHWDEYADKSRGACINISFDFSNYNALLQNSQLPIYIYFALTFGRVFYDHGYDFDFFKEVVERIQLNYEASLTFEGSKKMAMLYKRDKYRWEDESRIAIDLSASFGGNNASEYLLTQHAKFFSLNPQKHILFVKNNNPLFSWKIKGVYAGPRMLLQDFNSLKALCSKKGIPFYP